MTISKSRKRRPTNKVVKKKTKNTPIPPRKSGSLGRSLLTGAGSALGAFLGFPSAGRAAGNFVSDIVGLGAYKVNSNSIMKSSMDVPSFTHSDDSITVSHREYITDIKSSIAFSSTQYLITPDNFNLFPWLAPMAAQYEQYEFQGLVFAFNSTSGNAVSSTNNALGTIIMATEYNIERDPFLTKSEMENYEYSTSGPPSSGMLHPIECNPRQDIINSRYTTGPLRVSDDVSHSVAENLQVVGRLQIATQGMQAANVTVGELWATYKIKFLKPRISAPSNFQGNYHITSPLTTITGPTEVGELPNMSYVTDSSSSLQNVVRNNNIITFNGVPPKTTFEARLLISVTSGSGVFHAGFSLTNMISSNTLFIKNPGGTTSFGSGVASIQFVMLRVFTTNDDNYTNPGTLNLGLIELAEPGSVNVTTDFRMVVLPHLPLTKSPIIPSSDGLLSRLVQLENCNDVLLRQLNLSAAPHPSPVISSINSTTDTSFVTLADLSRKVSELELSRSLPSVCEEEKYEIVKILKN